MPNHTLGGALIQTVRLPDFGGAGRVASVGSILDPLPAGLPEYMLNMCGRGAHQSHTN
jgi:hypothetical protein